MAKRQTRDIFLNWFSLDVTSGANATTLATKAHNTAAGVSTYIAWRVHMIEWFPVTTFSATNLVTLALSTRKNLGAMPAMTDKGLVSMYQMQFRQTTSGAEAMEKPYVLNYLPPMIIASPNLSLYVQASTNGALQQSVVHQCRLGFTMVELSSEVYAELWQTWNFAD